MGLPLSWITLSLLHILWVVMASEDLDRERNEQEPPHLTQLREERTPEQIALD